MAKWEGFTMNEISQRCKGLARGKTLIVERIFAYVAINQSRMPLSYCRICVPCIVLEKKKPNSRRYAHGGIAQEIRCMRLYKNKWSK